MPFVIDFQLRCVVMLATMVLGAKMHRKSNENTQKKKQVFRDDIYRKDFFHELTEGVSDPKRNLLRRLSMPIKSIR